MIMHYVTEVMSFKQVNEFCRLFDLEFGTERHVENIGLNKYYVFCADIETTGGIGDTCRRLGKLEKAAKN